MTMKNGASDSAATTSSINEIVASDNHDVNENLIDAPIIISDVDYAERIPDFLQKAPFIFWKRIIKNGKQIKLPLKIEGNELASDADFARLADARLVAADKTNPNDWIDFSQAAAALNFLPDNKLDGLGVILSADAGDNIVCIDLDKCFDKDGNLSPFANDIVKRFNGAYIEVSQSGNGLHIFFIDEYSDAINKHGKQIEIYSDKWFIALTGNVYLNHSGDNPVFHGAVSEIIRDSFVGDRTDFIPVDFNVEPAISTDELLNIIRRSKVGKQFNRLFDGDISGFDDDWSRADFNLCLMLCFWANGNCKQILEIWQMSALAKRDKFADRAGDYDRRTIAAAVATWNDNGSKHFEPKKDRSKDAVAMPDIIVEPIVNLQLPDDWNFTITCPDGFAISNLGIDAAFENRRGVTWRRISHSVILVEKIITNIDTGVVSLKMRHCTNGRWFHLPPLSRAVISTNSKIATLAEYGVDVRTDNASIMAKWIADFIADNHQNIEHIQSVDAPGWQKDGSFVYPNSDSKFQLVETIRSDAERFFTQAGDISVIKDILLDMHDNDIFMLTAGVALAAPLVKVLGAQGNIALHLYGNTGCGKSSASKFAFALFGNPNEIGAIPTADATRSGLENVFAVRRDLPTCIEDIDGVNDEKTLRVIRSLPYQYANAVGRIRANKDGGNRRTAQFSGSLITTGEHPITDDRTRGGSKRRVLEIFVPNDYLGTTNDEIIRRAARINNAIQDNYGIIGRLWIDAINLADRKALRDAVNSLLYGNPNILGLQRQFPDLGSWHLSDLALAAVANAFFRVNFLGATDFTAELQKEYQRASRITRSLPSIKDISDVERAKSYIVDFITAHPAQFDLLETRVNERFGVRVEFTKEPYVAFIPSKLHDVLNHAGFDASTVIKQLADDGFIERRDEHHIRVQVRLDKFNAYCYKIPLSFVEPPTDNPDEMIPVDPRTVPLP